ncbi:thymus high mobility group box protein TOX [Trichuris trichiura]|uniref:Thymus high mobility group box protein TOX n=1 Tax=Trichuris trichiura TaxID=36087 RepID=A0A077ZAP3_TRITR|nr:thymus high mobility group box protein TOX [Trichuris trichiura]
MNYGPSSGAYGPDGGQALLYTKHGGMQAQAIAAAAATAGGSLYVDADFGLDFAPAETLLKGYCYEQYATTPQQTHHGMSPHPEQHHLLAAQTFGLGGQQQQHPSPEAVYMGPTVDYDQSMHHQNAVKQLSPSTVPFGLVHMASLDYQDINSLEPSFLPGQVDLSQRSLVQTIDCSGGQLTNEGVSFANDHQSAIAYRGQMSHCPVGSFQAVDVCDREESNSFDGSSKRPTASGVARQVRGKRQGRKRKPKKDPNEPQKPVSAYALFFRDTQATIKGQNPNASFGEVSKIVATMWDGLNSDAKNVYKQKTESAKKDYLKQLAAYRANLLSKQGNDGSCILQPCGEYFNQRKFLFPQTFPDSTGVITEATQASHEFGGKTLASLIAEPAPQQMLTATTTLTVPQSSYSSNRTRANFEVEPTKFRLNTFASGDGRFGIEADCRKRTVGSPEWEQENSTAVDDCVIRYCRDAFDDWVECGRPQRPHTYAPV